MYQGSGPAYGSTSPFSPSVGSGTGTMSDSIASSQQEFGPFAQGQPVENFDPDAAEAAREAAEAEADGADFGGESYTSRPHKTKSKSSRGNGTGTMSMSTSDTRSSSSRGTGSQSYHHPGHGNGPAPYNHQFLASLHVPTHAPGAGIPRPPLSPLSQDADADADGVPPSPMSPHVTERKKHHKSKPKPKSHAASLSLSTSSQSATASATASELTSPPPSELPHPHPRIVPAQDDNFEGFPGDFSNGETPAGGAMVDLHAGEDEAQQAAKRDAYDYVPVARFPSAGFGRTNSSSKNSNGDAGVFLARRGDE